MLFKEMKGVNFSCASPAAASICTSIDRRSMVRPTIVGGPTHPSSPRLQRSKTFSQSSKNEASSPRISKSSRHRASTSAITTTTATADLASPGNSSRYLLDDTAFLEVHPELGPGRSADLEKPKSPASSDSIGKDGSRNFSCLLDQHPQSSPASKMHHEKIHSPRVQTSRDIKSPVGSDGDQVVVLRVSLHCKGCEGKVRRHISRMQGVTSFQIDSATKKVTVKGDVTPLGVLNSVLKVKNAQFWPLPAQSQASF